MNKLAYIIIQEVIKQPGLSRKDLSEVIKDRIHISFHGLILELSELTKMNLLVEIDDGIYAAKDKESELQDIKQFSDEQMLDKMISHLVKRGGPSTIDHLNSDLKLHMDEEDKMYYQALLARNTFIKTSSQTGGNILTLFPSEVAVIEIRKFGSYLGYLEEQRPKPSPEERVLRFLEPLEGWQNPSIVFEKCKIDNKEFRRVLVLLGDKIERSEGLGSSLPLGIMISDAGIRYLHKEETSSISQTFIHNNNSTNTFGDGSPVYEGNISSGQGKPPANPCPNRLT